MFAAETKDVNVPANPAASKKILASWKHIATPVEPFLEAVAARLAKQVREFDPAMIQYAEYALTGQGKHLRPLLVALSAQSIGKLNDSHVTVAVIIEMVHLATLVHDDVMDEAEVRRGKLTLGASWGNEIAVLFGDCLFAQALKLAASFPTPEICREVAMATNTVCSGEILQTQQRRNFKFSEAEYFKILGMKTAELFALSCDLGACLSGAKPAERKALREFGVALGTAYQIYDDCLDLFGSEVAAGKSLGTDLAKGKLTLPVLRFARKANSAEQAEMQRMINGWKPEFFSKVLELLAKYDAVGESLAILNQYLTNARESLRNLPESSRQEDLNGLTDFLVNQADNLRICV